MPRPEPVREARPEPREPVEPREPREARPEARDERGPRRRDQFGQSHEQPEFLRRPVRRTKRETSGDEDAPVRDEAGPAADKSTV
jgi:hypothetical protein